jgi:hypothetical protein
MLDIRIRNVAGGLAVAVILAAPFIVPAIAGIATWKYVMGALGLGIFVFGGMRRSNS